MALDFPTSPTDGQVYDNYIWVAALDAWRRLPIDPAIPLGNLADVTLTTPVDGEVLAYSSGDWVNSGGDFYSKTNILGTVSQTAGVPTGAIIETGTNANGTFIKYADGTQICLFKAGGTLPTGATTSTSVLGLSGFRTNTPYLWTYPAAFVAVPAMSVYSQRYGDRDVINYSANVGGNPSSTQWGGIAIVTNNTLGLGFHAELNLIAIGRWF
jgi:hypothetical protein